MPNLSIRGLDQKIVERLKRQAKREGRSLNSLVVKLLQGDSPAAPGPKKFDDLDALAGTWTAAQARQFERDTSAFSEVDPALWN